MGELGLNEQEYVFLVLLARLLQTKPGGWTLQRFQHI